MVFSVRPGKYRDSTLNKAIAASFYILSNSLVIKHPLVQRYKVKITNNVVK